MFKQISVLILAATGASAISLHDDGTKNGEANASNIEEVNSLMNAVIDADK